MFLKHVILRAVQAEEMQGYYYPFSYNSLFAAYTCLAYYSVIENCMISPTALNRFHH